MKITGARRAVEELWRQAVAAVDPARCVWNSSAGLRPPTRVLAVGKAAGRMSVGAAERFGTTPGLVITGHEAEASPGLIAVVGDHPLPGARSLEAGLRVRELCDGLGPADHLLVLLSGGASALLELPVPGVTVQAIAETTLLLMQAGADIGELNTVRTHLSRLKGGGLAELASPAVITTLALSDVLDDDPRVIGSGPTVPTPTEPADALRVLDEYELRERVPRPVVAALDRPSRVRSPASTGAVYRVVAGMTTVARAAVESAQRRGLTASVLTTRLSGEARTMAVWAIEQARSSRAEIAVLAGETTVIVRGDGQGGRNQEAALAAAVDIAGDDDVVFLAAGTDGIDGRTPAAGGLVDGRSVKRAGGIRMARLALERNDSAAWLVRAGDQLVTGPTGTNVGDLWIVWKAPDRV